LESLASTLLTGIGLLNEALATTAPREGIGDDLLTGELLEELVELLDKLLELLDELLGLLDELLEMLEELLKAVAGVESLEEWLAACLRCIASDRKSGNR
jgi:hypothetical protein